jgi:hypothetical protein
MRELNTNEVLLVSGGDQVNDYDTMSFACFASWVFFGISPVFGGATIASAVFSVMTNCSGGGGGDS